MVKTCRRRSRGFTLIELLIAIVVIGILAAIAIPMYLGQRDRAKEASLKGSAHAISVALQCYAVDQGDTLPASPADLATLIGPGGASCTIEVWPRNPWTGLAVDTTSTDQGDITYTRLTSDSYTLTMHGSGGAIVTP